MSNNNQGEAKTVAFTAASGKTVQLRAVSPLLIQKVNAGILEPEPPKYSTISLTGDKIEFFYDESSIQDPSVKPAERAAWEQYLKDKETVERQRREKLIDILFAKGILIDVPDDGWDEDQRFLGVTVPENPVERRIHYLQTEVFTSAQDLTEAIAQLMQLAAGMSDAEMAVIRNSFRGAVQGATAGGVVAEAAVERSGPATATTEGVDLFDPVS